MNGVNLELNTRRGHSPRVERIMPAMGRWLLRVWLALSLLLLVACGVAWVRGLWWEDELSYLAASGTQFRLVTQPHALELTRRTNADEPFWPVDEHRPRRGWSAASHRWGTHETYCFERSDWGVLVEHEPEKMEHSFLGFGWDQRVYSWWRPKSVTQEWRGVVIPIWFIMLVLSIAPVVWFRQRLRLCRRRKNGLCLHCGYDLRATPDRCPECGHETKRP